MKVERVLIVEDDPDLRQLIRVMLKKDVAHIDEAGDGDTAIEKLEGPDKYDLVILDIMLPQKNGFEVAEHIKKLDRKPKILVVSAIARYFDDRFERGTAILQKPFTAEDLLHAIGVTSSNST
jgi:DNA-binding response OmpR family regulator